MKEFVEIVKRMRSAQKCRESFDGKNPIKAKEYYEKSKKLEKQVDDEIKKLETPQTNLFSKF